MSAGANNDAGAVCRVCSGVPGGAFTHRILGCHDISYFYCESCGLLQTETPYWLDEAYAVAIADRDTGLVQRNLQLADVATCLLWRLYRGQGRFLDAAGGLGLFTRLMRDIGFDYHWWDPHATNELARGFDSSPRQGPFAAVSAFEVLEHLVDPVGFLRDLRRDTGCDTLITSTELFRGQPPAPGDWWYYAFDTGQHISFYQPRTLQTIAEQLGMRLYSHRNIHVWTTRPLPQWLFRWSTRPGQAALLARIPRRRLRSRVWSDSELLSASRERSGSRLLPVEQ